MSLKLSKNNAELLGLAKAVMLSYSIKILEQTTIFKQIKRKILF